MGTHEHNITGSSTFIIDVETKRIVKPENMPILVQGSHNSERILFSMPRYINGHDMSLGSVSIHYADINTDTGESSEGVYGVDDLSFDEENVTFSWMIKEDATRYWGGLCFSVQFECFEDGKTFYQWNTVDFAAIPVYPSRDNTANIIERYPDIMVQLFGEIAAMAVSLEKISGSTDMSITELASLSQRLNEAEENILKGDWNELDTDSFAYIKNKPPLVKGEGENSLAVLTAKALSDYAIALGTDSVAGVKGYYYSDITINDDGTAIITLTDNQDKTENADISVTYAVGDIISLVNNTKYPNCATITEVNGNKITVDQLPFTSVVNVTDPAMDDYSLYVIEKPTVGVVPLGYYAIASGEECVALERASNARGRKTKALGQYASTEGRQTEAQYCGHAENYKTKAIGKYSHSEGREAEAIGDTSHVEGYRTKATGQFAHAQNVSTQANGYASDASGKLTRANGEAASSSGIETVADGKAAFSANEATKAIGRGSSTFGCYTQAHSDYQSVRGRFNEIDTEGKYLDIVGNGNSEDTRSNAYALTKEGKGIFSYGVEGRFGNFTEILKAHNIQSIGIEVGLGGIKAKKSHSEYAQGNTLDFGVASNKVYDYCAAIGSSNIAGNADDSTVRYALAVGYNNRATGGNSSALGNSLYAIGSNQHVIGKFNVSDADKALIIGNGADNNNRNNAHTVDWDGNAFYAGEVECSAVVMKSPSGKKFRITVDDDGALCTEEVE